MTTKPEDPHDRVRRLRDQVEEISIDLEIERGRVAAATRLRHRAGQARAGAIERRRSKIDSLAATERELAAARASLPDGPMTVTERAIVRWLELVEGVDIGEVRRRILSAMRRSPPRREGDYLIHDVGDVRIVANPADGKAFTVARRTEDTMFVKNSQAPVKAVMRKCGSCGTLHGASDPCPSVPASTPAPAPRPTRK